MRYLLLPLWLVMIIAARCVPHLANFSPLIALSLFAGVTFNKRLALAVVVLGLLISDMLLAMLYHYPVFGSWTAFVYSGLIATVLLGAMLSSNSRFIRYFFYALGSCLGFWLWTNLASWWTMSIYQPHSFASLTQCYIAALPFLQRSLIGTLLGVVALYLTCKLSSLYSHSSMLNAEGVDRFS